ncbi:MAG: hypothetical protein ACTSPA_05015 [Promethearchaeota archaeon]
MLFIENLNHNFTTIESLVLLMYGGFILLLILFGWDLLTKYVKADKRTRSGDPAYMIFFIIAVAMIGYGLYTLPATINYFFKSDFETQGFNLLWLVPLQYFLILLMIIPIGYVCLLILAKNKKIIALAAAVVGAISIIYMFALIFIIGNDPTAVNVSISSGAMIPIAIVIGIFAVIDFFGLVYILVVKLAPQKEVRNKVLLGIMGIVIAGIGGALERGPNNWIYPIGVLIELVGFLIMRHFFLSIPSYDEFAWKSGMIELHVIIAETGISLYFKSFAELKNGALDGDLKATVTIPESERRPNSDLVAGGLVGIKGMLAEISGEHGDKGKLENIEIGSKSLVFKQGDVALCLLLAEENLGVYHTLLEDLVQRIEKNHPNLDNFTGNLKEITIAPLVTEIFGLKE